MKKPLTLALLPLLIGACGLMPPSFRKAQQDIAPDAPTGPAPSAAATPASSPLSVPADTRMYPGSGKFANPSPSRPPVQKPEEASLNFEAADVREVAKVILGDYLKVSYTVHPQVTGSVTFRTVKAISLGDLLPTLEMLLRQNNAAVVQEDGLFKVVPISMVRGSLSPVLGGPGSGSLPQGFSVVVIPLKYVGAKEMERLLTPFAPDNSIRVDEIRNMVILAGTNREMKHLIDTIEMFDVDFLSGYSVGLFQIKSSDVKALVADFEKVFGAQSPIAGVVRVIPVERLNALLVVTTNARYLETAKMWIDRLDTMGGTSGGSRFFVYQVRNGKAENLAQLIGDLFASRRSTTTTPTLAPGQRPTEIRSAPFGQPQPTPQTTTTTVTPAPAAASFSIQGGTGSTANEVRVIADKDTNSLLILSTPTDYEVIESALRKLDVVRRQVLVEVLLAEVLLTDDLQFGIDWFIRQRTNGIGTTYGTMNTMGALPAAPGFTPPVVPGTNPAIPAFSPGLQLVNLSGDMVRAVLRTFGSEGRAQILATPQIMVLDNEKAEIKVGQRISVQTQTQTGVTTGTGVLNSFQYLETGVLMSVSPRINSGGMVTLEVNQEVSEPTSTGTAINPNPDVSTRNAKTSVVVASGESIVLAGLIREVRRRNSDGLPLLSKIPFIGALFGTQSLNRERSELVLLITPKIVSDPAQAREVTQELRGKLPLLRDMLPPAGPAAAAPTTMSLPPPTSTARPESVPAPVEATPPTGAATPPAAAAQTPPAPPPPAAPPATPPANPAPKTP